MNARARRGADPSGAVALLAAAVWLLLAMTSPAVAAAAGQVEVSPTGASPALAYNAGSDEFLVVWSEASAIVGRRLEGDGTPIGPSFAISSPPDRSHSPAVAYDRQRHRYLVAWATGAEVRGRWVSGRGASLGEPTVITQGPAGTTSDVTLSYNAIAERYLVAWVESFTTTVAVRAAQLDAAGTPLRTSIIGSGCALSAAASEREPRWVVAVYQLCSSRQVPGRIVGVGISTGIGMDMFGREWETSVSRAGVAPGGYRPGVAFAPASGEYLVGWWAPGAGSAGACPCDGVHGQRLSPGGAQVGRDDFLISAAGPAPQSAWPTDVAIAHNRRWRLYLVAWEGVVAHGQEPATVEIFGQYLRLNGAQLPPDDFKISAMGALGAHAMHPVVAASTRRRGHLVAWDRVSSLVTRQGDGIFARWLPPRR